MAKKELELKQIGEETEINGEWFVPILELLQMAMDDIFGANSEKGMSEMVEVFNENDKDEAFGVVTSYYDTRIGFTFNYEKGRKEFELSADGDRLMLDQLQLFDKLREWGFKI
jgi:hypothetical protein